MSISTSKSQSILNTDGWLADEQPLEGLVDLVSAGTRPDHNGLIISGAQPAHTKQVQLHKVAAGLDLVHAHNNSPVFLFI